MPRLWGVGGGFMGACGHQIGQFCYGFYDGATTSRSDCELPLDETVPLLPSTEGKRAIGEALRSNDPDRVISTIDKVCRQENLSRISCVHAAYYCVKAIKPSAEKVIRDACFNLIGF